MIEILIPVMMDIQYKLLEDFKLIFLGILYPQEYCRNIRFKILLI